MASDTGGRESLVDCGAQHVLADLESLALSSLRREMERLRWELEEDEPEDRHAHGVAGARMATMDALELWQRAHDARMMVEMEGDE